MIFLNKELLMSAPKPFSQKVKEANTALCSAPKPQQPSVTGNISQESERRSSLTTSARSATTKITVRYDVGFNNFLSIRGHGADLHWDRGVKLKNVKPDLWVWESPLPFHACEFKVLINDQHYEVGSNHIIESGSAFEYTPKF